MKTYNQLLGSGEAYLVLYNIASSKGKFTHFVPVYEADRVVVVY